MPGRIDPGVWGGKAPACRLVDSTWHVANKQDEETLTYLAFERAILSRGTSAMDDWQMAEWRPQPRNESSLTQANEVLNSMLGSLCDKDLELFQYRVHDYADDVYVRDLFHLSKLHSQGKFQRLGLVDADAAHLELVLDCGFPVSFNQVSYSIIDRRATHGRLAAICAERKVNLLARDTLLGGLINEDWLEQPEPTFSDDLDQTLRLYLRYIELAGGWPRFQDLLRALNSIARKHHVSIAAVAIRDALDTPCIGGLVVDPNSSDKDRKDLLAALSFAFDTADRRLIMEIKRTLNDLPGDCGDEKRQPLCHSVYGTLPSKQGEGEEFCPKVTSALQKHQRLEYSSGSKWEPIAGYCRAIRIGNRIRTSGTTANSPVESMLALGGTSARSQTVAILDIIERSLRALGASMQEVVYTRIMVVDSKYCDEVSEVHGWAFQKAGVRPANTLIATRLMEKQFLVEIEAEAEILT